MTNPPRLTDTDALAQRRARATPDAMFLQQLAVAELQDRLEVVNKSFTAPAVVTDFPSVWDQIAGTAERTPATSTLPLAESAHDLVIHGMSLHWANDPVGQLIQCRRALRPDGLFLAVCFGGQTLEELRACLGQAEVEVTGGLSPRVAPMAELRDLGALLQRAGFALPVSDAVTQTVEYRDIWHLMRDLRAMGEGNALTERFRIPTRRAVFERANTLYLENFATGQGRIQATFELIFLTGWAPADNQPKPLRPGSAQQRLADALGATETKLHD